MLAKGLVERANSILQDRLVKELRLEGINDIDTANAYLPSFREKYNQRFGVEPSSPHDAHRQFCPKAQTLDLIFSSQSVRTLSKNLELSYQNRLYQIQVKQPGYGLRQAKITICEGLDGEIRLFYRERELAYVVRDKRQRVTPVASSKELNPLVDTLRKPLGHSTGHKPKAGHPWVQYERSVQMREAKARAKQERI